MAERSLTLVELHLHDGVRLSVAGRELLGSRDDDADGTGTGRRRARTAGALLLAAAVLAVAWRLSEGDLDAVRDLDGA